MTKQERKVLQAWKERNFPTDRGNTWTGFRPVVFKEGKYNKKASRKEGKEICRRYT